jgi:type I restriction enzyme, S subunit
MKTYPEHKDSKHQLIGLVPEHWDVVPNGRLFRVKSIKNTEDEQNLSVYRDYGVIRRDSRDDNHNRVSEDISNYKLVEVGDFVLNKMKCWMGSLGVSEYRGIVSPSYTVCEPIREIHRKYFHYLLRSRDYIQIYDSLSYGVRIGQWELRFHDFKKIKSLYPPLPEQKQISNYLDRKTQQIDDLIEKTERKIELLKEQRSSLINQCVTKGLDPNVEMKDSGVEWVGEIPKGWYVSKIRYITEDHRQGYYSSEEYDDDGFRIVRITDIQDDHTIDVNSSPFYDLTEEEISNFIVKDGDFLFPRTGGVGRFGIVDFDVPSIYGSFLIRFRFNKLMSRELLKYFFESQIYLNQVLMEIHGGVNKNVHVENIKSCGVLTPPLPEQQQISDYLDRETSKIDRMVDTETKRTELLEEYRQSLISNVVTGKIDVRDEVVQ